MGFVINYIVESSDKRVTSYDTLKRFIDEREQDTFAEFDDHQLNDVTLDSKKKYAEDCHKQCGYRTIPNSDILKFHDKKNQQRIQQAIANGIPEDDVPLIKATWFMDSYWYYYFLSPFGDILTEGETPYAHKEHPYVIKAYPFIDGEIHSFVSDVIDQQRYTNRLITLYDWIMLGSTLSPKTNHTGKKKT